MSKSISLLVHGYIPRSVSAMSLPNAVEWDCQDLPSDQPHLVWVHLAVR
jgi:hypothetical protein